MATHLFATSHRDERRRRPNLGSDTNPLTGPNAGTVPPRLRGNWSQQAIVAAESAKRGNGPRQIRMRIGVSRRLLDDIPENIGESSGRLPRDLTGTRLLLSIRWVTDAVIHADYFNCIGRPSEAVWCLSKGDLSQ